MYRVLTALVPKDLKEIIGPLIAENSSTLASATIIYIIWLRGDATARRKGKILLIISFKSL